MTPTAEFTELYVTPEPPKLLIFEELVGEYTENPFEFAWATTVADVTNPWPKIEDPDPVSIRDAIRMLSGRTDVTNYLYTLKELDEYAGNYTAQPCERCRVPGCSDKWCDLRGDDDGELRPGASE